MIDATTFHRSIEEISKLSQRLGDDWTLHDDDDDVDDSMPESAYLSKRSKVRIASRVYTFEYHILYNLNYSVPVLLFNAYASDGSPVSDVEVCQPLLVNLPKLNDRYVLMQQEHPRLRIPFMTFHPCKTSEIMETFANKTRNPVISWISAIGPHVHLNIPIAYLQLT